MGYHSRTPDEFQKYLQGLKKPEKKKNWIQIMILVDLIIIMVVLYFVSKHINPSFDKIPQKSNKIEYKNWEMHFIRSRESIENSTTYFLFVSNKGKEESIFPEMDVNFLYKLESENESCIETAIQLNSKPMKSNTSEVFTFHINRDLLKQKSETCQKIISKKGKSIFERFKTQKPLKYSAKLELSDPTLKTSLQIDGEHWEP